MAAMYLVAEHCNFVELDKIKQTPKFCIATTIKTLMQLNKHIVFKFQNKQNKIILWRSDYFNKDGFLQIILYRSHMYTI